MAQGFEALAQDPIFALGYGLLATPQNPIQGAFGVLQSGAQASRQASMDKRQDQLLQMQMDTQKQNQDYRNQMIDLQKMRMQMPQIQPMFNPVTGAMVGYDKRTGQAFNMPIGGDGASMGGQMGGMGGGGEDMAGIPSELYGNPRATQAWMEQQAKNAAKKAAVRPKMLSSLNAMAYDTKRLDDVIGDARTLGQETFLGIPTTTGAVGQLLSNFGGTSAKDLSVKLDDIKAAVGFDALSEMRNNSPTGGALGSITDREIRFLQSKYGNLEQAQSQGEFLKALDELQKARVQSLERLKQAYIRDYGTLDGFVDPFKQQNNMAQPSPTGGMQNPNAQPQDWRATNPDDLMRQFNIRPEELQ
jgi:hypothetical protein